MNLVAKVFLPGFPQTLNIHICLTREVHQPYEADGDSYLTVKSGDTVSLVDHDQKKVILDWVKLFLAIYIVTNLIVFSIGDGASS